MLVGRDKVRIYRTYILREDTTAALSALNTADIELLEEGSDFSVFFLHIFWPITKSLPWLFFVFIAVISTLAYTNIQTAIAIGSPELAPLFTACYFLFLLTVAAFGNDWRRARLLRKGYEESGRICAVNKARALEFFFNSRE